jgi:hypothetical protein
MDMRKLPLFTIGVSGLEAAMNLDEDRIDDAVLALLYLGLHNGYEAWKGFDWSAMERLHEKGLISNPKGKAKSVAFNEEGLKLAKERCEALFGVKA